MKKFTYKSSLRNNKHLYPLQTMKYVKLESSESLDPGNKN